MRVQAIIMRVPATNLRNKMYVTIVKKIESQFSERWHSFLQTDDCSSTSEDEEEENLQLVRKHCYTARMLPLLSSLYPRTTTTTTVLPRRTCQKCPTTLRR